MRCGGAGSNQVTFWRRRRPTKRTPNCTLSLLLELTLEGVHREDGVVRGVADEIRLVRMKIGLAVKGGNDPELRAWLLQSPCPKE